MSINIAETTSSSIDVKKKKFKMPHAYIIIILLLIIISALTYVIPAGVYTRVKSATGMTLVDPASFHFVESNPVPFWMIPNFIVKALIQMGNIIFPLLVIAGGLQVILATNMFHAYCSKLATVCAGKEKLFIPVLLLLFSIIGITQAPYKFIGFAPLGVMLAATLGYDAIVGVAITLGGIAIGFSCGIVGPTTAVAQQYADLPAFSGMSMRIVTHVVLYIISALYIMRYAERAKKDPTKSVLYGAKGVAHFDVSSTAQTITFRHHLVFAVFVISFGVMMYGCVRYNWNLPTTSVSFIWMAIAGGLAGGLSPNKICDEFVVGFKGTISAGIIIGLGTTLALMLQYARVLDTVVMYLASMLNYFPNVLKAPILFFMNTIINFFVSSATGQAAIVMPVMTPLADLSGITRQTAVLAYKLGDGLSNYIYPHVSSLMGFLGAAGIAYNFWMKFMGKLFILWVISSSVIMMICYFIQYQ